LICVRTTSGLRTALEQGAAQPEPAPAFYRAVGTTSYVLRAEALLPASA
jgi:hypothetical protein